MHISPWISIWILPVFRIYYGTKGLKQRIAKKLSTWFLSVWVRVLQINRSNRMCIYRIRFILRTWLTWLGRLASPKSAGWTGRLETQKRASAVVQVQRSSHWKPRKESMLPFKFNYLLLRGSQAFVLFRPSNDWVRPTHIWRASALLTVHWLKC